MCYDNFPLPCRVAAHWHVSPAPARRFARDPPGQAQLLYSATSIPHLNYPRQVVGPHCCAFDRGPSLRPKANSRSEGKVKARGERKREERERECVCADTERWRTQRQTVMGTRGSNGTAKGIRNGRNERLEATTHDGKRKGKCALLIAVWRVSSLAKARRRGLYTSIRIVSMRATG